MGIGAALREAREGQGRSLEDAAARLRARVSQLDALEEERFEDFGGDVYAKGFLRSYATELGLDPRPLLEVYRREAGTDEVAAERFTVSMGRPGRQRPAPPAWMAWVLVAVVVLAGVALIGMLDIGRTPDQASTEDIDGPPPSPATSDDDADEDEDGRGDQEDEPDDGDDQDDNPDDEGEDEDDDPEDEADPDGVDLLLALEADSWMRVIVDGSLLMEQTVPAGETLPFEGEQEIEVRFGNAGGVRANLNGEDLGTQGSSGEALTLRYTPDGVEEA